MDSRMIKLAKLLVNYSCDLQKGENVFIEYTGVAPDFVSAIINEVYRVGGFPFVSSNDSRIMRSILMQGNRELFERMASFDCDRMKEMQAYIGIRGGHNSYELSDVPDSNMKDFHIHYGHPVHHQLRVKNTKWVILRYPTEAVSQLMGMSTMAFEDFYYNVCTVDYKKMGESMTPLVELMNKTDKVHIIGNGTDLTFSIKDIPAIKCNGERNIPDGEVYTAPIRDSINGVIKYNVPSINGGTLYNNVQLEFEKGKIIKATSNNTKKLNEILDTDEGARYVGEFALGVNPAINKSTGDILFDEKISGSIHLTPGSCYDDAYNGNESAIHWDLVLIQTAEAGGGKIYFDDVLIREDGLFVIDSLKGLNP